MTVQTSPFWCIFDKIKAVQGMPIEVSHLWLKCKIPDEFGFETLKVFRKLHFLSDLDLCLKPFS